jgi:hypothetical protein
MGTVLLLVVALLSAQTVASPRGPAASGEPTPAVPPAADRQVDESETAEEPSSDPSEDVETAAAAPEEDRLVPVRPMHEDAAARLLRDALRRPTQGALTGTDVTLYQMLVGPLGRPQRAELIRGYWRLSAAIADYHDALAVEQRIEQLAQIVPESADATAADQLKLELATAHVRVAATRLAAVRSQHHLGQLRPDLALTTLPLPADPPHTGGYRTLYERIFAGQTVPAARRLNATLPLAHDLIAARATAVEAADRLLTAATDGLKSGRGTAAEVFGCYRQLVEQQQALVAAVHDYNLAIAEYAQLVAPAGSDPTRLVAMLIQTRGEPARPLPAAASGMPAAAAGGLPTTTGRLPAQADGLMSVLRQPPAARATTAEGSHPGASDQGGAGVVQATAEEPLDDGRVPLRAAQPPGGDSLVPRRLQRGP